METHYILHLTTRRQCLAQAFNSNILHIVFNKDEAMMILSRDESENIVLIFVAVNSYDEGVGVLQVVERHRCASATTCVDRDGWCCKSRLINQHICYLALSLPYMPLLELPLRRLRLPYMMLQLPH